MSGFGSSTIKELTTWANMRLTFDNHSCSNILTGIMEGETMKCFAENLTGVTMKRLGSLDGLSATQKVTRVDWFIDMLKRENKLTPDMRINSQYFAQHAEDHIFPVMWELIVQDIHLLWQISPTFQNRANKTLTIISEPIKAGPFRIAKAKSFEPFYKEYTMYCSKRKNELSSLDPEEMMMSLVNMQLKTIPEGKKLSIKDFDNLANSKILCALVNSFVPGTFTSEVLLNDRWSINLALSTANSLFGIDSAVTSVEINEGDEMGSIAFLTYLFVSGFQFLQAKRVIVRYNELQKKQRNLQSLVDEQKERTDKERDRASILDKISSTEPNQVVSVEETSLKQIQEELSWLSVTYDINQCQQWSVRSDEVQAEARSKIYHQMKQRFDIITVPENTRSIPIMDLCEENVINLALTNGNGFCSCDTKEILWTKRRLVVRDRQSGEIYDDFSGAECPKGSIRGMLGLHPVDNVEVASTSHPDYELFFESPSNNRMLKSGSRFLYQVFPGTPKQSQRLLRQAARTGDLETVEKLTLFYKSEKEFVNIPDQETGNLALHLASRNGHFKIALHLLENGSDVNTQNKLGCTPFFVSVEGLNGNIGKLLIEWGGNINIINNISKTALEIIRNPELKIALTEKNDSYMYLSERLRKHDVIYLEKVINGHLSGESTMSSLNSRCVDGCTLLHWAALLGSVSLTKKLLNHNVDSNLRNSKEQTALHLTRNSSVAKLLLEQEADVNQTDCDGNTPIHTVCQDTRNNPQLPELITILINAGGDLSMANNEGLLSIHYAIKFGKVEILEAMMNSSLKEKMMQLLKEEPSVAQCKSLLFMAMTSNHIACAEWLIQNGVTFKEKQPEKIAFMLLTDPSKQSGIIDKMNFLFGNGLDSNAESKQSSLLHYVTALTQHPDLTDLLISRQADIASQNKYQRTPIFVACMNNNFHSAKTLLEKGASYTCCDVFGKTAFDYIKDHKEWMDSGYFSQDTIARLKAYSLKHSRLLVQSLTQKLQDILPTENSHSSKLLHY